MTDWWPNQIFTISDFAMSNEIFYFKWHPIFLLWTKSCLDTLFLYCCKISSWSHGSGFWVSSSVFCIIIFSLRRSVSGRNTGYSCSCLVYGCEVPIRFYLSISCFLCMFYFCKCWIISHFWSQLVRQSLIWLATFLNDLFTAMI